MTASGTVEIFGPEPEAGLIADSLMFGGEETPLLTAQRQNAGDKQLRLLGERRPDAITVALSVKTRVSTHFTNATAGQISHQAKQIAPTAFFSAPSFKTTSNWRSARSRKP